MRREQREEQALREGRETSEEQRDGTAWRGTDDWKNGRVAERMRFRLERRELNITRKQPHTSGSNERPSDRAPPAAPPRTPFLLRRLVAEPVPAPLPRPLSCRWSVFPEEWREDRRRRTTTALRPHTRDLSSAEGGWGAATVAGSSAEERRGE